MVRSCVISPPKHRLILCSRLAYHEWLVGRDREGEKPSNFGADRKREPTGGADGAATRRASLSAARGWHPCGPSVSQAPSPVRARSRRIFQQTGEPCATCSEVKMFNENE